MLKQRPVLLFLGLVVFITLCAVTYNLGQSKALEEAESNMLELLREQKKNDEWIEVLSWKPRAFLYHNFLTPEEGEHIINLAGDKIERSKVVASHGGSETSSVRTSSGVFLVGSDKEDPVVQKLEQKIAKWTQLPAENGEAFYLLRYEPGEQYLPHTDWFHEKAAEDSQRICTVILYLREPEEGGETIFPNAEVTVPAKTGNALLFWDVAPDGIEDNFSLHAGAPVIKGTKWALTKWIRERRY